MASREIVGTTLQDAELEIRLTQPLIHQREQTSPAGRDAVVADDLLQLGNRQLQVTQADHQSGRLDRILVVEPIRRIAALHRREQADLLVEAQGLGGRAQQLGEFADAQPARRFVLFHAE